MIEPDELVAWRRRVVARLRSQVIVPTRAEIARLQGVQDDRRKAHRTRLAGHAADAERDVRIADTLLER